MIYKGSRYTKTPLVMDNDIKTFSDRDLAEFSFKGSKSYIWTEGDTLDGVSLAFYGTSQYWWVILDANYKYVFPTDIKVGDVLSIPSITEVLTKI